MTFNLLLTFGAPHTTRAGSLPPQSRVHTFSLSAFGCGLQSIISAIKRGESLIPSAPTRKVRSTFFFFFFLMRSAGSSSAEENSDTCFSPGSKTVAGFLAEVASSCALFSSSSELSSKAAKFVADPRLSLKPEKEAVETSTSPSLSEFSLLSSSVAAPMRAAKPNLTCPSFLGLLFLLILLRDFSSSSDISSELFASAARVSTSSSSDP